ncbi:MAG: VacJ family lipoprotein [Alphaproteobacteria bacterium]|nr:VacJ family lipoprotein [Alphaproteobacteria bacterium]MBT5390403.1 VacJ family lipoprotein [Alphaproteobacteria bacterium]MBT5540625.1 VacJ family lipoprotein [Alphaproteobacteria bacterium]
MIQSSHRRRVYFLFVPLVIFMMKTDVQAYAPSVEKTIEKDEVDPTVGEDNDPLEGMNKAIFDFNHFLDAILLKPVSQMVYEITPQPVQDGVHNFLQNLNEPLVLLNEILQLDGDNAADTLARFLLNTTFGVLGLFDIASEIGIYPHEETFGETLAVWGIGSGPYLVLPLFGPNNVRGTVGRGVDYYINPFNYYAKSHDRDYLIYVKLGVTTVDTRIRNMKLLDQLEEDSIDLYATIRSLYWQNLTARLKAAEDDDYSDRDLPSPFDDDDLD